ncbi:MAG: hypothetical protein R3C26_21605 [Calditrichia bacterium]
MESEEIVVTSARHKNVLERTITALQNAIEAIEMHATEEIISVDIRRARLPRRDHRRNHTG